MLQRRCLSCAVLVCFPVLMLVHVAFAQTAGMLSFQGLLKDDVGQPVQSAVDMEFRVYDSQAVGTGTVRAGPFAATALTPANGVVSTKFGPVPASAFDGTARWLEVRMRTPAGSSEPFITLSRLEMATAPATAEQMNKPGTGASVVNVDSSGNVGVSPLRFFHVQSQKDWKMAQFLLDEGLDPTPQTTSVFLNGALYKSNNYPPSAVGASFFRIGGTAHSGMVVPTSFNAGSVSLEIGTVGPGNRYSSDICFRTLADSFPDKIATEKMRITGKGDVYIGQGSATAWENNKLVIRGPNAPAGPEGYQDLVYQFDAAGSARIRGYRGAAWDTYLQFLTNASTAGADNPQVQMTIDSAGVHARVLHITGGDLAEPFAIAKPCDMRETITPGKVVVIDSGRVGQLKLAAKPYDCAVAGVVSGANGLGAGVIMKADDAKDADAHPVAIAGRVWCWCDASYGQILPGDRLTTSATPGHAMKVTDKDRADGAVIGKAMSRLVNGRGLVLVLVQPQ